MKESTGAVRVWARMRAKLLPIIDYYLYTSYSILLDSYRKEYIFIGIYQRNILSHNIYRDILYFIFKALEILV